MSYQEECREEYRLLVLFLEILVLLFWMSLLQVLILIIEDRLGRFLKVFFRIFRMQEKNFNFHDKSSYGRSLILMWSNSNYQSRTNEMYWRSSEFKGKIWKGISFNNKLSSYSSLIRISVSFSSSGVDNKVKTISGEWTWNKSCFEDR